MTQATIKARKAIAVTLLALLWLPATVMLSTLPRGFALPNDPTIWLSLWPTILAGLPLAAACRLIYRRGNGRAAIITFLFVGLITVLAAIVGGLFGPVGIFIYCGVASIPAWMVWGAYLIVGKIKSNRRR